MPNETSIQKMAESAIATAAATPSAPAAGARGPPAESARTRWRPRASPGTSARRQRLVRKGPPPAKVDVLRPSLGDLGETPVHPRLHEPFGKGKVERPACPEIRLGQSQIFHYLVAHRRVGADRFIGLARRQDELAVGDHVALASRAVDRAGVVSEAEQEPDLRHDEPLPEGLTALMRGHRQQPGTCQAHGADRASQQLGLVSRIGIGEEE